MIIAFLLGVKYLSVIQSQAGQSALRGILWIATSAVDAYHTVSIPQFHRHIVLIMLGWRMSKNHREISDEKHFFKQSLLCVC